MWNKIEMKRWHRLFYDQLVRRWKQNIVFAAATIFFLQFLIVKLHPSEVQEFNEAQCADIYPKLKQGLISVNEGMRTLVGHELKLIGEKEFDVTGYTVKRPLLNCLDQEDELLHRTIKEKYFVKGNVSGRGFSKPYEELKHPYQTQDLLELVFKELRNGFYVEAGAWDSEQMSVSLLFEVGFNWTGILIEANPWDHQLGLLRNRNALYLNTCLGLTVRPQFSDFVFTPAVEVKEGQWMASMGGLSETLLNPDSIKLQCFPFYSILMAAGNPTVNLLILDIEGAEFAVLKTIPWNKVDIQVMTIETDLIGKAGISGGSQEEAREFIISKGYTLFKHRNNINPVTGLENNDLFIRNDIVKKWNIKFPEPLN
ncbi:uncharacterized protein LOC111696785 [Eurytemora carolleeae]|uniref:uncharacterized protein LOC111696785 n=1 Tax=Eurytemora carolleeae TaxID=1294199 RepID=UPI000C786D83|nr:uncharacterized protein LOC111696785 [Eurytemora carolleeae]|eukprot:XP_023322284.1 uncharacterized protein LOC111696785 [Eurytemora affinis]